MQSIAIFGSTLLLLAAAQPITIDGGSKFKITITIEGVADKSYKSTGIDTEHTTTARPTSNYEVFLGSSSIKVGVADKPCKSTENDTEHTTTTTTTARPTSNDEVFFANTSVKVNWITAQQICNRKGMNLVSIDSEVKTQQLLKFLKDNYYFDTTDEPAAFWTSGTRKGDGKSWVWLSTGLTFEYTNWSKNEPNDSEKYEECVTVYPEGDWNDLRCIHKRYFICENRGPVSH